MQAQTPPTIADHPPDAITAAIAAAAHLLPQQGPIGVFVHHNTLHAFQHLPFEEAVVQAGEIFGARPYLSEREYRQAHAGGRIRRDDVVAVLAEEPDCEIWPATEARPALTRRSLREALMLPGLRSIDGDNLQWHLEEGDWLSHWRPDLPAEARARLGDTAPETLFQAASRRCGEAPLAAAPVIRRPRDYWLQQTGRDLDDVVHPTLIRLIAAFVDQGVAHWPMPHREQGFWRACLHLLGQQPSIWSHTLKPVSAWLRSCDGLNLDAHGAVRAALEALRVREEDLPTFIRAELLALPGWAGLVHRLESEPGLAPHERVPCTLMDFLAVRLALTVAAWHALGPRPTHWREAGRPARVTFNPARLAAASLFDAAQLLGIPAAALDSLDAESYSRLSAELAAFDTITRCARWHLAYERRHEQSVLGALVMHLATPSTEAQLPEPRLQVVCCIDEREESFRRHLEEVSPACETFGAAGFFGAAIDYQGMDDAHGVPLCPVVLSPQHAIREVPAEGEQPRQQRRQRLRRLWSALLRPSLLGAGTVFRGSLSTVVLGVLAAIPVTARILNPRAYARLLAGLRAAVLPMPRTELTFSRRDDSSGDAGLGELLVGFSVAEKADRVAAVLRPAGLSSRFAPLVVVLGHGSTSLNNPHESAHDCGACGGRRGGPNARLFALMANHPEVRARLATQGLVIPASTWFVGGYHDTSNDQIDLHDLHLVPASHTSMLAEATGWLDAARAGNAHERARRLEAAPLGLSAEAALRHVEDRAEHLGEPRPEYGHCTNAVCVVAPRDLTRGLFLDRRAFLFSYESHHDLDDGLLARVLGAAIPVCGGINLEYFFSFVDQQRYGCGTKLPHNITGLVGVMDGYQSDLRTGLPLQMVELHEPVRILFVVATTPERLLTTVRSNPITEEFLHNRWIRVATVDPEDGHIEVYRHGRFEAFVPDDCGTLPEAQSSPAWYAGSRGYLPIARIRRSRNSILAGSQT